LGDRHFSGPASTSASSAAGLLRTAIERTILLLARRAPQGLQGLLDGFHRCQIVGEGPEQVPLTKTDH